MGDTCIFHWSVIAEALCNAESQAMVVASAQMLSDRVFSAIITLGAAFQCLGFVLLRLKVCHWRD